jgi:Spy/CpxP family protein refolding chaperone
MNNTHVTRARSLSALAMAAALVAAPLVAAPLAATAASGMPADGGSRQHHMGWHDAGRHAGHHGHFGGHGLRALDLSQEQQDQIFKIRHDQAQAFYDQRKALRAAHESLRELSRADAFDEAKARQAADALGQAQAQMALLRAQTGAQIRAVLTPEQREKLAQMRAPKQPARSGKS